MSVDKRKRILYVENGIGYGGAVVCLLHLARNLDANAYSCRIVTGRTGPEYERIGFEFEWRHIPDRRLNVVALRRRLESFNGLAKIPGLAAIIGQIIARLDDVVNFFPFLVGLWREIREYRPHLIHANNDPLCNRAALLLGRVLNIPTVSHVRGPQKMSWMVRRFNRIPDCFLPVSHWIDRELESFGIPASKRIVIPDGIEFARMESLRRETTDRRLLGLASGDFAVGLVGLLMPWKGHQLFLDAAVLLRDRIPGLKIIIVGGTPEDHLDYETVLRARVVEEGLSEIVVFTGHVRDILPVYQALDVVVSASILPEPLGTMVIEAMAIGRPLIVPAHGGGAEMNTHGVTALLYEPGSATALSEAILRLHESEPLRRCLGAAARERALARFAVASHVAGVEQVYRRLLGA